MPDFIAADFIAAVVIAVVPQLALVAVIEWSRRASPPVGARAEERP